MISMTKESYTEWAGCRRASYGFNHTSPDVNTMLTYVNKMVSSYSKNKNSPATGALVWIVGEITDREGCSCKLNFPKPSDTETPDGILFNDEDFNEPYLTAFDKAGYDVWLQVEPGLVDIEGLAKLVMTKYKKHPCVKGFGIDVEWFKNIENGEPGTPLDDETAEKVDRAVKEVNPAYSVFVKHWEPSYLPQNYRGVNNDMIFVTDSQEFESASEMTEHYSFWSEHYEPNPVFFQIGYYGKGKRKTGIGSDEKIWKSFKKPLSDFGKYILSNLKESTQKRGIIWVDFSFTDAFELSK